MRAHRLLLCAVGVLLLLSCAACDEKFLMRTGKVIDYSTRQPVSGVTVEAECREQTGIESSRVKRRLKKVTDAQGRVYFSFKNLWDCDWVAYYARKPGYTVVSQWTVDHNASNAGVNLSFSLEKNENLRLHYIKTFFPGAKPRIFTVKKGRKVVNAEFNYRNVFAAFHCAHRVARSAAETALLRKLYCPFLIELENRLTPEQHRQLLERPLRSRCTNAIWVPFKEVIAHSFRPDPDEARQFCSAAQ